MAEAAAMATPESPPPVSSTSSVGKTPSPVEDVASAPLDALIEEGARQRLCGGKVLLRVRLACDEVAWVTEPAPLFLLAPRLSYLPFFFNDVYENFKSYVPPLMGQAYEIWFDCNGEPLRWHYPLGVLCDVVVGPEVPIPLDLTVHFRGCPSDELLPFSGIGDLKNVVMSAFRQAVFMHQGSAAPFMKLPMQQQQRLWDAIKSADLAGCSDVQRLLSCSTLERCKSLAVRLHIRGQGRGHTTVLHPAPVFEGGGVVGGMTTVRSFLHTVLPPLLPAETPESGGGQGDAAAAPRAAAGSLPPGTEIVSHGLRVPLETPLYWLALNAAYLDNFVHLAVRLPRTE